MEDIIQSLGYELDFYQDIDGGCVFQIDGCSFTLYDNFDLICEIGSNKKEYHLKNDVYFCSLFPEIMEHLNEY